MKYKHTWIIFVAGAIGGFIEKYLNINLVPEFLVWILALFILSFVSMYIVYDLNLEK